MSFTDIKTKSQGFTIVELLIVVVVIAILAAITIVSYNGITNRANASAAASTASSLQKKIELYYASQSAYPTQMSDLTGVASSESYYVASGTIKVVATDPTTSNGKDSVRVYTCSTGGIRIVYQTFGSGTANLNIGNTGTCSTTWTANP